MSSPFVSDESLPPQGHRVPDSSITRARVFLVTDTLGCNPGACPRPGQVSKLLVFSWDSLLGLSVQHSGPGLGADCRPQCLPCLLGFRGWGQLGARWSGLLSSASLSVPLRIFQALTVRASLVWDAGRPSRPLYALDNINEHQFVPSILLNLTYWAQAEVWDSLPINGLASLDHTCPVSEPLTHIIPLWPKGTTPAASPPNHCSRRCSPQRRPLQQTWVGLPLPVCSSPPTWPALYITPEPDNSSQSTYMPGAGLKIRWADCGLEGPEVTPGGMGTEWWCTLADAGLPRFLFNPFLTKN